MSDRERELQEIRETYDRYRSSGRARLWDPANDGYRRMVEDRDRELLALVRRSLPSSGGRVLDVGCGDGRLAAVVQQSGVELALWTGVDLGPSQVASASSTYPWASFVQASVHQLPLADGSFDVVIASMLFSSLPSSELEHAAVDEIRRVLVPNGWLVWYDLRYPSPGNSSVHAMSRIRLGKLFPGWHSELNSSTLLPPLARRLGHLDGAYSALHRLPILRSHLVGRLRSPESAPANGQLP